MTTLTYDVHTSDADNLFAGDFPRVELYLDVRSGEGELTRGTALGVETATGKLGAYDALAGDGVETARFILADDADATSADATGVRVFATGEFRRSALTGVDDDAVLDLRDATIFVK